MILLPVAPLWSFSPDQDLTARAAILVDSSTGNILYQKDPHDKLPPASITKVATIAVALENLKKDQLVTISEKAAGQEPNKIVMKAGEKLRAEDLFYGLMMISANDAAWAIASQPRPSMTLQTCVGADGSLRLNVRLVQVNS